MNYYYELADCMVEHYRGKYWATYDSSVFRHSPMVLRAERIWREDQDGTVCFIKHRWQDNPPVDMKEFFWVKLKCQPLCK